MVTTFYPPYYFGGDSMFVYRLAETLAARGHRVDVVHSVDAYRLQHPAEPEVTFSHHPNVTRHPLKSAWALAAALAAHQLGWPAAYGRRLREILNGQTYDVIHYHNVSLMGGPGVLRLGRAVKLYTTHEYWLICPTHILFKFNRKACTRKQCLACTLHSGRPPQGWRYTGLLQRCARHVDCFLMPSRFALERHRAEGLDRPMVHLPSFVPTPAPERRGEGVSGIPLPIGERPFFLFAGRLEKLKGVQDLLQLFEGYDCADLVVAGTGSYASVLQEQARHLRHAHFLGQVHPSALGELYHRAIAQLMPSLCYEVFPLTVAESLAQGTPVIARHLGAFPEIIEQSGGGFTFRSLEECRQAMERLRLQPELRAEMGRRGLAGARQYWSPEAHLKQYLGLVTELLSGRNGQQGKHGNPDLSLD
jgi:glycosyltransferase involved in cell wall biosynthesis